MIGQEGLDEDLLVAAGDSIFGEGGLDDFARLGLAKNAPVTAVIDVGDLEAVKRYSAITTDGEGRITAFEEKPDQPGRLVEWMYERTPFYAWQVPGRWYDIGSPETLEQADREFSQS